MRPPVLEEKGGHKKGVFVPIVDFATWVLCLFVDTSVQLSYQPSMGPTRWLALLNSLVCSQMHSVLVGTFISDSTETVDGGLGGDSSSSREHVGSAGDLPVGGLALPDASGDTLDALLSAEGADVLGPLGDFEFLDDLSEGGAVAATVLSADSNLLCSLCHYYLIFNNKRFQGRQPIQSELPSLFSISKNQTPPTISKQLI